MNIMLVSVRERTREIGIRKAVGARRRDILAQFLLESVVMSGLGGGLGIAVGVGGAKVLSLVFAYLPTQVSAWAVLMAFGFSAVIGIFFGIYPARRASLLDPIHALRYE
jgi:putative ABC transport system permease protein